MTLRKNMRLKWDLLGQIGLFRITAVIRLGRHQGGEQGEDNYGFDHGLGW
jgi:hypothetical protein